MLWKKAEDPEPKHAFGPAIFGHRDAFMVIQQGCARKLPAMVVIPDTGLTCRAAFDRTSPDVVLLKAPHDEAAAYRPQSVCFIVFSLDARGFMFPANVLEHDAHPAGTPEHICLAFPEYVVAMEIRQWFRVTVPRNTALVVQTPVPGGGVITPKALNISLGGLLLAFEPDACPNVHEGGTLRIRLVHDGIGLTFTAEVRRRRENEFGLAIPADTHDTAEYRQVVTAVEREWLQQRAMYDREE